MYAVIFRAKTKELDKEYFETAKRMRELALSEYNCIEFTAVTEGLNEIAISYWKNLEEIQKWKENGEHLVAQELGKNKWYKAYNVEIVKVVSQYSKGESYEN
jgi:heme-degrading monooxygenase HmoA